MASVAFFVSLAARGAGPAMGLWFLWLLLEQLIGGILVRYELEAVAELLPFNVASSFFNWNQYDPVALQAAVDRAIENGRRVPEIWENSSLFAAGIGWVALFLLGSYLWYRKRDL